MSVLSLVSSCVQTAAPGWIALPALIPSEVPVCRAATSTANWANSRQSYNQGQAYLQTQDTADIIVNSIWSEHLCYGAPIFVNVALNSFFCIFFNYYLQTIPLMESSLSSIWQHVQHLENRKKPKYKQNNQSQKHCM